MGRLNKQAPPGMERFESAGQTNARDLTPALGEDLPRGVSQDLTRIAKSRNESPAQAEARRNFFKGNISQQDAAGRAIMRMLGRAGYASTALEAGYGLGREIDERTGIGRKMVDKAGSVIDELAAPSSERVKLSPEAQRRVNQKDSTADNEDTGNYDITTKMKKGGKVKARSSIPARSSTSKRADGIAVKGHTRGKYL